ncbi:MAG: hypothetical protein FWD56_02355 [Bacteroidales bacterium]|nr:hypothetical protein [Bacteroidales bacterium]
MRIFLTIILIILLLGYFFPRFFLWLVRSRVKKMQKQYDPKPGTKREGRGVSQHKKRMNETIGEYVDFEEIKEA